MRWVRFIFTILLCTFWGVFHITCAPPSLYSKRALVVPPVQGYQQYYKSIAKLLLTPGEEGFEGAQATGFAIDPDHLITAGHFCTVLQRKMRLGLASKEIQLLRSDKHGNTLEAGMAVIIANAEKNKDPVEDICLLRSKDHQFLPLTFVNDMNLIETEDPIVVVGSPSGFFPIRREGHVSSLSMLSKSKDNINNLLLLSVNIQPGSSGSPVIWNGQVIGMIIKTFPDNILKDGALATRADRIVEFINRCIGIK